MPGLGPGTPFLFAAAVGGGASIPLLVAAGVLAAFESAPLATCVFSSSIFAGVGAAVVDDEMLFVRDESSDEFDLASCGNLVRTLAESLSITIFDLTGLEDDFEDEVTVALFAFDAGGAILMEGDGVDANGNSGTGVVVLGADVSRFLSSGPTKWLASL
jgi:hypothetical protein